MMKMYKPESRNRRTILIEQIHNYQTLLSEQQFYMNVIIYIKIEQKMMR